MKEYKNSWFLPDMTNIDKAIVHAIEENSEEGNYHKNKGLWLKYATFVYLSGARRMEPFLMPPYIYLLRQEPKIYVIRKVNEKHFNKAGKRIIEDTPWLVHSDYEMQLFYFLLEGRKEISLNFDQLLGRRLDKDISTQELRLLGSKITHKFEKNFIMEITNGEQTLKTGIPIHLLRHLRAYELVVNKGYPPALVQKLIGWNTMDMVFYYAQIQKAMRQKEVLAMYEKLPNFRF
mgnify:FL=1